MTGLCLERGFGVRRDLTNAAKFYPVAAERRHADGMSNFAFCLELGHGIELDLQDTRRYYARAMEIKHLGQIYSSRAFSHAREMRNHGLPRLHSIKLPPLAFLPEIRDPRYDADLTPICEFRSVSSKFARDARLVIPALAAPRTSAPEQFEGFPPVCGSDVYSFGLILWETIVGHPEFPPDLPQEVVMSSTSRGRRPGIPRERDAAIAAVIRSSCLLNREKLPPVEELFAILKDMKFKIFPDVKG